MRQSVTKQDYKTPLLGDVPGLGKLFRSQRDQSSTVELVILLRPLVVQDSDWPGLVKEPTDRADQMTRDHKLEGEYPPPGSARYLP
jgi:type II secretory pathway component GspD/PulD (secretin)